MAGIPRSIWLVGLSGAGKSTVGPILAGQLGWDFVDLDGLVEELGGRTVSQVFREDGEAAFRGLEAEAAALAAGFGEVVVSTGGGWMARRDLDRAAEGRIRVWLRVRPEVAIHRLSKDGEAERPLLARPDPEAALAAVFAKREAAYAEAELSVETEGLGPEEVAAEVLRRLRTYGIGGSAESAEAVMVTETETANTTEAEQRS